MLRNASGFSLLELLVVVALVVLGTGLFLRMQKPSGLARLQAAASSLESLIRQGGRLALTGGGHQVVLRQGEVVLMAGSREVRRAGLPSGVRVVADPPLSGPPPQTLVGFSPGGRLDAGSATRVGVCAAGSRCLWLRVGEGGTVWREVDRAP